MAALGAILFEQSAAGWATPQWAEWVGRADKYARPDTAERARADSALGIMKIATGDMQSGYKLFTRARDLARRLGDQESFLSAASNFLIFSTAPQHIEERIRIAEELWASLRVGMKISAAATAVQWIGDAFLASGQRQRAEEVWSELRAFAERTGNVRLGHLSAGMDSVLALMDGRLEDVMDMAESIRTRGEEAGMAVSALLYSSLAGYRARFYLGLSLEDIERGLSGSGVQGEPLLCLVQAHLGMKEEAWEILVKNVVKRPGIGTVEDETSTYNDTLLLEASVLAGQRQAAELLLNCFSGKGVCTPGFVYPTCIPRHLGGAAALLERYDEARKHY